MSKSRRIQTVLVTGGAGYVGAVLVPLLLREGYQVRVLDLYLFGNPWNGTQSHSYLREFKGDIRDQNLLKKVLPGSDAVIHLACISNDPSFELNPALGRAVNFETFEPLVRLSKSAGVHRFIYASSSSVYGISDHPDVTEDHPLAPLTDYSKYKGLCETILSRYTSPEFTTVTLRPATVCGYSPRLRLDLTVNMLTNHAVNNGKITVFGGRQMRPNIHIQDMVDLYALLLELPSSLVAGKIYNAGYKNFTVADLAEKVKQVVSREIRERRNVEIVTTPTDDDRSYHISSQKIKNELGFEPKHTIEKAVQDLVTAFQKGLIPNPMTDARYYNIKTMQALNLQ